MLNPRFYLSKTPESSLTILQFRGETVMRPKKSRVVSSRVLQNYESQTELDSNLAAVRRDAAHSGAGSIHFHHQQWHNHDH
jgi:hypothetical protein